MRQQLQVTQLPLCLTSHHRLPVRLKPRDTTTNKAKSKGLTARHQAGRVDSEIPGLWPPGWWDGLREPSPVVTRLVAVDSAWTGLMGKQQLG